jgi:Domain of unknown function (DUF4331)
MLRNRRRWLALGPVALTAIAAGAAIPTFAGASSHREAPAISQDPAADNTDVYAFRSPDAPDTATLIANFYPAEEPAGGPYFYRFSDQVKYEIAVDNTGDGEGDVTYEFRFKTKYTNPDTSLYNTAPISYEGGAYKNLNQVQTYDVKKVTRTKKGAYRVQTIARDLLTPPANVGPRSTPNYAAGLVPPAIHTLKGGAKVFAGQRDDPFFVDTGAIFDLLAFRQAPPAGFSAGGDDGLTGFNVQSIALQIPIRELTRKGNVPTDAQSTDSTIGVYAAASRPVYDMPGNPKGKNAKGDGKVRWTQVSRLAVPLINEVIIPTGRKDRWNATDPSDDSTFERHYLKPELAAIMNQLYNVGAPTENRKDLSTILLQGIPPGVKVGDVTLPTTQIGAKPAKADLLRLNLAVGPTPFAQQNRLGLLAGQGDGFPNGRRLVDDTVDIDERAVAGVLAPLFGLPAPGPLAAELGDGVNENDQPFLPSFPYVATPISGFDKKHPRPPTG